MCALNSKKEKERGRQIPFFISEEQEEMLNKAKSLGQPKNWFIRNCIVFGNYFNNRAGLKSTREAVIPKMLLENLREDLRQKGASAEELAKIDVAVSYWNEVLDKLTKKGDAL